MKCVIFCGGKGTRLREETEYKPKPLVEVGSRPILWHIMKIYSCAGIKDFILPIGYRGDMIKRYIMEYRWQNNNFTLNLKRNELNIFNEGPEAEDWNITCVDTGIESGTGTRLKLVKEYLSGEENFCMTYGDGVANIDISKVVEFHKGHHKMITITGVHTSSKYGQMIMGKQNAMINFQEKPVLQDYINGGFMVINKRVFDFLPPENHMFEPLLSKLAQMNEVMVYFFDGYWHCMDTYQDYIQLNDAWQKDKPWKIWR